MKIAVSAHGPAVGLWGDFGVTAEQYWKATNFEAADHADPLWAYVEVSNWLAAEPFCKTKTIEDIQALEYSLFICSAEPAEEVQCGVFEPGKLAVHSFACLLPLEDGAWELSGVVSSPEKRGKGYGTLVVSYLVDLFEQSDTAFQYMCLVCPQETMSFYQRLGFSSVHNSINKTFEERRKDAEANDKVFMILHPTLAG